MFRPVITRAARRSVVFTAGNRISRTYPLRWNSSQPVSSNGSLPQKPAKTPEMLKKKAALEREDDRQRDWDARVISYVELLPKTQSPSPVSEEHVYD